jgi:phosphoglycerate dehydrogenase-like enzyme
MLLAAARRFPAALRSAGWAPQAPARLAGGAVTIVGAGGIGRALIRLLAPFEVHVTAVTRSGADVPGAARSVAFDALDEVIGASDAIVVAAPQTPETVGMISADRLRRMRPGAVLVNVARGPLVDTDALVDALREGLVGAAFLDVTDPEPLPDDHPLWSLPNAVITSHTASTPALGARALAERVRENVARYARGEELLGIVDPDAGY